MILPIRVKRCKMGESMIEFGGCTLTTKCLTMSTSKVSDSDPYSI